MRDRAEDASGAKIAGTVKMATVLARLRGVACSSVSGYVGPALQRCSPLPPWLHPCQVKRQQPP